MIDVNYLAVLVAGVVSMIIGALWYSPAVFGKQWVALSKMSEADLAAAKAQGMTKSYILAFIGSLVMAYVLAHVINMATLSGLGYGMSAGFSSGFWMWLGFIVPIMLGGVLWENKSWKLYFLNAGHYLVAFLVMGAIIGAWGV